MPRPRGRGPTLPFSPCSLPPAARRDFPFLSGAEVSQRDGGPRVTARHATQGEGRRRHSHRPRAAGRDVQVLAGAPRARAAGRAGAAAALRVRGASPQAGASLATHPGSIHRAPHPPPRPHPPGPAPTPDPHLLGRTHRGPTHPGGTRPGPHLPGAPQSAQREFPGRWSSSRTALRRSLAMAAMPPARGAGAGTRARVASVCPSELGPRAARPPPPPLRHPGRPQPARRFRIPAARPGSAAAARVAAAAAERVPARGPGRTARSGRHGPRAAPSGAGG